MNLNLSFKCACGCASYPWNKAANFNTISGFISYLTIDRGVYVPPGPKWYCRVAQLFNFTSFLCSTLLILSMTFDRFYSIIMPHKAASFNTVKRAKITVACIVIVSILYNLPHLYLTSYVGWECLPYANAQEYQLGKLYFWLSLVVQFALPFVCLLTMNSVIIHKIRNRFVLVKKPLTVSPNNESSQGETSSNKHSEMQVFVILLLVTFAFLVLATPAYLFFLFVRIINFFKSPKLVTAYFLFWNVAHKMYISNHGINFFLYVISGKKFRTDLRNLFPNLKKSKRSNELMANSIKKNLTSGQKI